MAQSLPVHPGGGSEPASTVSRSAAPACLAALRATSPVPSVLPSSTRSEEHTSELQSRQYLVCRLLLEKKKSMPRTSAARHVAELRQVRRPRLAIRIKRLDLGHRGCQASRRH